MWQSTSSKLQLTPLTSGGSGCKLADHRLMLQKQATPLHTSLTRLRVRACARKLSRRYKWDILLEDEPTTPSPYEQYNTPLAVFTRTRWEQHQNISRYVRHISSVFTSRTFNSLKAPLLVLTGHATLVTLYETAVKGGSLPPVFTTLNLTDKPFELTSFALALLLVFRTDASYARYTEALDTWNSLRNSSSQFVRNALCWISDEQKQEQLIRWTIAFSKTLNLHLKHSGSMGANVQSGFMAAKVQSELTGVLLPHEIEKLQQATHMPQYALMVLTGLVSSSQMSDIKEDNLLDSLNGFSKAIGTCEKIYRYPVPLTYTRHTSRFMMVWLAGLPFALWDNCGWGIIPITTLVSFFLLGIEEIGVQIEEPFSVLPLKDICRDIQNDIYGLQANAAEIKELIQDPEGVTLNGSSNSTGSMPVAINGAVNGSSLKHM